MTDLRDLPPPEGGPEAEAGYYPDPLGGKYPRWWDGSQWTYQTGPEPKPELAPGESDLVPRRPRDVGALIGATFRLYGRYPSLFPVLAVGVILPYDLIVLAATGAGVYSTGAIGAGTQITLAIIRWVLITPLVSALHVHAVKDVREGREPGLGPVARRGLAVLPVVAAATIMSSLGIALGLIALIVPGVILYFRWFVVAQVAAIDHEGWLPALRGSRQLTAGNYAHIFVFILLTGLIVAIPGVIVSAAFGNDDVSTAGFLVGLVVDVFTTSFLALATAALYYDLVARREAGASVT